MKTFIKTPIPSLLIALIIGLLPQAQAVSPPPDGGYPGGNTAEGQGALFSRATGGFNSALGFLSLRNLTTGSFNTGVGAGTLLANTADENTATGAGALLSNTTGGQNTANGAFALFRNTGVVNTAIGDRSLFENTTGNFNTAVGVLALSGNTTGSGNTAIGVDALSNNTTPNGNTAIGASALVNNTIGGANTATGGGALAGNTTGNENTAIGTATLSSNIIGHDNTAIGFQALMSNTTGSHNIALGDLAGELLSTGDYNIDIGSLGLAGEANTIRIGSGFQNTTFIAGIHGVTTINNDAIPVVIDSLGDLGTMSSSRRFKHEIKAMDSASESILALKPVTFHYKSDRTNRPEFGLIAEEVAAVNPDLVVRDADGEIYTVRYDAVNAMLLNEFLKAHRKMEQQDATIARQQKQIEALTAGLQKVSAKLAMSKPAPQTVLSNQ